MVPADSRRLEASQVPTPAAHHAGSPLATKSAPVTGIVLTVFGFNLLNDGMLDVDPRKRGRN